ncbi:putative glycosidase [Diplonema papillatum]|nr:putative glycosidase [Diplonema papillatum]|eukprot:gene6366-9750_t
MHGTCSVGLLLLAVGVASAARRPIENPEELVNTLQGTYGNSNQLSAGNTLPLTGRPWGMHSWTAMTSVPGNSFYFDANHRTFHGIRCTHLPSPWVGDYAWFTMLGTVGLADEVDGMPKTFFDSSFSSTWKPYELSTLALKWLNRPLPGMHAAILSPRMSVTATERAAIVKVGYQPYDSRMPSKWDQGRYFYVTLPQSSDTFQLDDDKKGVSFTTNRVNGCGVDNPSDTAMCPGFRLYAYGTFSCPVAEFTTRGSRGVFKFGLSCTDLEFTVAASYISYGMAKVSIRREVRGRTYDQLRDESKHVWRKHLSRLVVNDAGDHEDRVPILYSGLYRGSMFPRQMHEFDNSGQAKHFSPYVLGKKGADAVFPGVMTTDHGFWDAYRTVYPLLSLLYSDKLGELLQGFVNGYDEGGWLPNWPSPGYRGVMSGSMQDVSVADAIVKKTPGLDLEQAYQSIRKNAFEIHEGRDVRLGRTGLAEYKELGYVPTKEWGQCWCCCHPTAQTLMYTFADWSVAQAAASLGHTEDAKMLAERAKSYENLFNPDTKFFWSKTDNGEWLADFDQYAWSSPYIEGGPWHYRFAIEYDIPGLSKLFGGDDELCAAVEDMMNQPATVNSYNPYHEMTEMTLLGWGQYAHSDQPVHAFLYVPTQANCPNITQHYVRRAMAELYSTDSFCGDEDNGEMGSWFVLSALGLFTLAPGSGVWVLGSPLFNSVTLHTAEGTLNINAPGNSKDNVFVDSVQLNGKPYATTASIPHAELLKGGDLVFKMAGPSIHNMYKKK